MHQILVIVSLLLAAWASAARADEPANRFIGALGGIALITTDTGGNDGVYGGHFGIGAFRQDSSLLSIGAYVQTSHDSMKIEGVSIDQRYVVIAPEVLWRNAWDTGLYLGARAGIAAVSADFSSGSTSVRGSNNTFAWAPVVGFEFAPDPKAREVLLSIDASWMQIGPGSLNFPGFEPEPYNRTAALLLQVGASVQF